jgi:hypothetical protein
MERFHLEVRRSAESPHQHEWVVLSGGRLVRASPETYGTKREAQRAGEAALHQTTTARRSEQVSTLLALRTAAQATLRRT